MYRHRQSGLPLVVALLPAVFLPTVLLVAVDEDDPVFRLILIVVLVIGVVAMITFSSLTIHVDEEHLRWSFGGGIFRKRVPLAEIESATATRTSPFSGWGIHLTRRGWLYNVAGLSAVDVRLRGGRGLLLGTDEPDLLARAIETARRVARPAG